MTAPVTSDFGSIVMRLLLLIPLMGIWLLMQPEQSFALSCVGPGSPSEELERADAVFMGRAVSVSGVEEVYDGQTYVNSSTTEFKVTIVWKGPIYQTVFINSGGAYGIGFVEGEEYIVYAYRYDRRTGLSTGPCTRTTPLSGGLEDLAGLGEGTGPLEAAAAVTSQPSSVSTPQPTDTPVPQSTDGPVPGPTPRNLPDTTETGGGVGLLPITLGLSVIGLLAGLAWCGLRKRRP